MTNSGQIPPHSEQLIVSIPAEHVLLLRFNRPRSLNAMTPTMHSDIKAILDWFDEEPSLWCVLVGIVTGEGRAFCAGADLKAWNKDQQSGRSNEQELVASSVHGFGAISRRTVSSKPIIAAVNGSAYGGGVEMLLNCDLVIASEDAVFALPEVKRGVVAAQGGKGTVVFIPRISGTAGHQFASEMLLLGDTISASDARNRFAFVNLVVPKAEVLTQALKWANTICQNSPDAVQSTKRGLILTRQLGGVEQATVAHAWSSESKRAYKGTNIKEGLKAFAEKRSPSWSNPAKL
ncbi:ClpP crotonase [Rickenella mellea]|uniref:ClpP crotonase n=1 Tax=Rickenella mellea TaxID=50990 RepID=A0A4Y7QGH6_9AGAM|nr:ClpP crotonase [Rickenella mellea]